jgi:hypothetical protein
MYTYSGNSDDFNHTSKKDALKDYLTPYRYGKKSLKDYHRRIKKMVHDLTKHAEPLQWKESTMDELSLPFSSQAKMDKELKKLENEIADEKHVSAWEKIKQEIKETKEAWDLVKKAFVKRLSREEKTILWDQIKDIAKGTTLAAIFLSPGGAVALPFVLKHIKGLLPSAFAGSLNEKKFEDYEPEQGEWVDISAADLKNKKNIDLTKQLYDLIAAAYAHEPGGHFDFKSAEDVPSDYTYWKAADIDDDPDPDAVIGGKYKSAGTKLATIGHDGTRASKTMAVGEFVKLFNTPGYYGETSKRIAHTMITKHNVPYVDNQKDVEKVLGKKVEWVGAHPEGLYPGYIGWYIRKIGNAHADLKIMMGSPQV